MIKITRQMRKKYAVLLFVISLGTLLAQQQDIFNRIRTGIEYFKQVYLLVSKNYVDDIEPLELMKSGIDGMLAALDPYTVFVEDEGIEVLNQITTGKYGGVGMEIGHRKKKVIVITPMSNSPARRAGILPGDIIVKIDGHKTEELTSSEISKLLRGRIGTEVVLTIKRPVTDETLTFKLIRAEITIEEVPYAGWVAPKTAYIKLDGFSSLASGSVRKALYNLAEEDKIERVILDLRGNPGGLLQEAVDVVNLFVPEGETVVYTKGRRESIRKYKTDQNPLLPDTRLVVLIDNGSASASEIVAGAVQDLDRGVIVGQPSFGKGLVQNVFNIDNGKARLKITTARYYVPSGRCIQKIEYNQQKRKVKSLNSDSLNNKIYRTRNGREVHGKGGIKPDFEVAPLHMSLFESQLWRGGYFFKFAVYYTAKNPGLELPVQITDTVIDSFYAYVKRDSFDFVVENESEYGKLLENALENNQKDLADYLKKGKYLFSGKKETAWKKYRENIRRALRMEISQNLGGDSARVAEMIKDDPMVLKAVDILNNTESYEISLAVKKQKRTDRKAPEKH
jgi:carboxyl-terminal processing protease